MEELDPNIPKPPHPPEESALNMPKPPQVEIAGEQPFEIPPSPRGSGLKIAIAVILVLLVAGGAGAGYWFFIRKAPAAPEQSKQEQPAQESEQPQQEPEQPAQVNEQPVCDPACFSQKFTACETAATDFTVSDQLVYHDEIIGVDQENGLCRVAVSFNKNPNPNLVGKEMVCEYDQTLAFSDAVKDSSKCSGALHEALNALK